MSHGTTLFVVVRELPSATCSRLATRARQTRSDATSSRDLDIFSPDAHCRFEGFAYLVGLTCVKGEEIVGSAQTESGALLEVLGARKVPLHLRAPGCERPLDAVIRVRVADQALRIFAALHRFHVAL